MRTNFFSGLCAHTLWKDDCTHHSLISHSACDYIRENASHQQGTLNSTVTRTQIGFTKLHLHERTMTSLNKALAHLTRQKTLKRATQSKLTIVKILAMAKNLHCSHGKSRCSCWLNTWMTYGCSEHVNHSDASESHFSKSLGSLLISAETTLAAWKGETPQWVRMARATNTFFSAEQHLSTAGTNECTNRLEKESRGGGHCPASVYAHKNE